MMTHYRMAWSQSQGGAETTVVTAFYSLILLTSALRAIWFLIPKSSLEPSYVPSATMAFAAPNSGWIGTFLSEMLVSVGSLCLFSIFILILVYWADILKKYFFPGARRTKPMVTFLTLVCTLAMVVLVNAALFLFGMYSSEAMLLVNALLLAVVSIVCVCQITIFSNKFRTVLMTLGAINQVSTESQVKRIMWITVTGNMFFATRALLEIVFSTTLVVYWYRHGNVDEVVRHSTWDVYIWIKHSSEVAILCLMLYILQSRFTTTPSQNGVNNSTGNQTQYPQQGAAVGRGEYETVPDADEEGGGDSGNANTKAVIV
jgi:hypothetical protein